MIVFACPIMANERPWWGQADLHRVQNVAFDGGDFGFVYLPIKSLGKSGELFQDGPSCVGKSNGIR